MRRRLLPIIAAVVASFAIAAPAFADTRVIVYPNQTPTSTEQNSNAQFARISVGSFERDAFGQSGGINATTGGYANLTIAPGTGLFVTVAPLSSTVGAGTVYQMGQNDPNPMPTGGYSPALPPSTTNILLAGQQTTTTSPIGPLTAPGAGNSVYYLIESQLQSGDVNPQSLAFVSSTGTKTFQSVNTNRNDQIVYQLKAGTAASTPTKPTTDTGWLPVGYALVPNGKTQILTSDITMSPPFTGFVQNANVVHVSPAASPTPDSGNAAVSGQLAGNQLVSTTTSGTPPLIVSSTTVVANLNAATAAALSPAPTPSAVLPIIQSGSFPNLVYSCTTCVTSVTASGNAASTGGTTPVISVSGTPTFTAVTTGALTVTGTPTLSSLASGCLQVNGSGVISTTSCGGSGGGVSAVTGTAPIVSSGGSTPAISCSTCVVLNAATQTGTIKINQALTSVGVNAGTGTVQGSSNGTATSYLPPVYTSTGAAQAGTVHAVVGTCSTTGASFCNVTLNGAAIYTSATSWACAASQNNTSANSVTGVAVTGTTLIAIDFSGSTGVSAGNYFCLGY